ncbi:hypothetical protein [Maritalea porphyrae]|uniref:hypothetical protein n=1 Tax=Maritalea porphyrae TaxID=880732 RepID=UPI0022AF11F0|nr:hypothetical protein [Maritalea porphyrae]MCZ4270731.1 hypothetical protein [Maritalea porphyrae]
MIRKQMLVFGSLVAAVALSFLTALVAPVIKFTTFGLRSLFTLDVRIEQSLAGIVQSLKTSFGNRWRSAKAFLEKALTHDKYNGSQFDDICSPSMQC